MALFNADGQINLTTTTGSTYTGAQAADGSYYIVINDGSTYTGIRHRCGALNAVVNENTSAVQHPNGSIYVKTQLDGVGYTPSTFLGGASNLPAAPVLAMDPAWTTADNTPDFIADFDDTVAAGDSFRLQIQASGGDWSSLLSDTSHVITAPEDAANEASLSNGSLSNGNYEARANVTHGTTSNWSNTVSFTVAAASSAANNVYPYLLV